MAKEIERKFLITDPTWKDQCEIVETRSIQQGYLSKGRLSTVRIRVTDTAAYITVKGKRVNTSCDEYEYKILIGDAQEMLALSVTPLVIKTRYIVKDQFGQVWDVDVFGGINKGLTLAEIELDSTTQAVQIPDWVGTEVSHDKRYRNTYLAEHSVVVDGKIT